MTTGLPLADRADWERAPLLRTLGVREAARRGVLWPFRSSYLRRQRAGVSWRPGKGEPETAAGSGFEVERLEAGVWGAPLGGGRGLAARGDRRQPVHLFLLRSEMRLHKPAAP